MKSSLKEELLPIDLKQRSKIPSSDEDSLNSSMMSADVTLPWTKSIKRESTDSNTSGCSFVTCSSHESAPKNLKQSNSKNIDISEREKGYESSIDVFDLIKQWNNELVVTNKGQVEIPPEKLQTKVATWIVSSDPYQNSPRRQKTPEALQSRYRQIDSQSDPDLSVISLESVLPQVEDTKNYHPSFEQCQYAKNQHICDEALATYIPEDSFKNNSQNVDRHRAFNKHQRVSIESAYSDASTIDYVYTDQESGIKLLEKRIPSVCGSVDSNCSVASDSTVVYDVDTYLSDKEIREKLRSLGCDPGPITSSTRQTYLSNLAKVEKEGRPSCKQISSKYMDKKKIKH